MSWVSTPLSRPLRRVAHETTRTRNHAAQLVVQSFRASKVGYRVGRNDPATEERKKKILQEGRNSGYEVSNQNCKVM